MRRLICRLGGGHEFSEWSLRPGSNVPTPDRPEWTWFRTCGYCGDVRALRLRPYGFRPPPRFPARTGPFLFWAHQPTASGDVGSLRLAMTASGELPR